MVFCLFFVVLFTRFVHQVAASDSGGSDVYASLRTFTDVLSLVRKNYVKEVDFEQLIEGAIKGMLVTLDPHSGYLNADTFKELQVETKGKFGGLGIEITVRDGLLTVVAPIEDSPAFRAGVEISEEVYGVEFPEPADIVIAGSHPCDLEMWQAHKTLYAADKVVKDGGTIIEVAPCYEGISVSHPDVLEYLKNDSTEIGRMLERGEVENVVAAAVCMAWARMRERVDIVLISEGIGEGDTRALGFQYFEDVQGAFDAALAKHGEEATVIVMTHAPEMLPIPGSGFRVQGSE